MAHPSHYINVNSTRQTLKRLTRLRQASKCCANSVPDSDAIPSTSNSPPQTLLNLSIEKLLEEAQFSMSLILRDRKMKEFPCDLCQNYDLSDLLLFDVSGNRLTQIPEFVFNLDGLETLVFRHNCLNGSLSTNFYALKSLTYLDLSSYFPILLDPRYKAFKNGNNITTLPNSLFFLPLKILLLSGNRLENLSRDIRQLENCLEEIDLSYNQLTQIPSDMGLLEALRVLNLSNNHLTQIPATICTIPLKILNLSRNLLTHLPTELYFLAGSHSGVHLYVEGNPLISPPIKVALKGRMHIAKWLRAISIEENNNCLNDGEKECQYKKQYNNHDDWLWAFERCDSFDATLRRGDCASRERNSLRNPTQTKESLQRRSKSTRFPSTTFVNGIASKTTISEVMPTNLLIDQRISSIGGPLCGSDSGYASTGDDPQRHSYEYIRGSLENISEHKNDFLFEEKQKDSIEHGDLAKEVMLAYAETMMEKELAKLTTQQQQEDLNKNDNNDVTNEDRINNNIDNFISFENDALKDDQQNNYSLSVNNFNTNRKTNKTSINLLPRSFKIDNNYVTLSPVKEIATEIVENSKIVAIEKEKSTEIISNNNVLTDEKLESSELVAEETHQKQVHSNERVNTTPEAFSRQNSLRKTNTTTLNLVPKRPTTNTTTRKNPITNKSMPKQQVSTSTLTTKVTPVNSTTNTLQQQKHVAFSRPQINKTPSTTCNNKKPQDDSKKQLITNSQKRTNLENKMSKSTIVQNQKPIAAIPTNSSVLRKPKLGSISPNIKEEPNKNFAKITKSSSTINLVNGNSNNPSNISQLVTTMCRIITTKVGIDLQEQEIEKIAQKLISGVILCKLINEIRPKMITTILEAPLNEGNLSSPKAKRNLENFIGACRRLGIPEQTLCSARDIAEGRNLLQLARTIVALNKINP